MKPPQRFSAYFIASLVAEPHDAGAGGGEPGVELIDQRTAFLLPDAEALLGRAVADFLLDAVNLGDALQGILHDRGIAARVDKLAAQMGPQPGR